MGFSVAIVGLPNVGKSTLFKALTKKSVSIAPYPFTTINPNIGIVYVPDKRLEKIATLVKPKKITPTTIEFVDVAGLVKGAHKGEGLGNQFLAQIRNCDAILMVIRGFINEAVENILGEENPEKEVEILKTELLMKDFETLENVLSSLEKEKKSGEKSVLKKFSLLQKIKDAVSKGKMISELELTAEEKTEMKEYRFLTQKPMVFLLNSDDKIPLPKKFHLAIDLRDEADAAELSSEEVKELNFISRLDKLIINCYNILELITFFTIAGGNELKAWTLKNGENVLEAAARVHTDFKENFIKAEVIFWEELVKAGGWLKAREKGLIQTVGKEYVVKDGDVIEFRI